MAERKVIIGIGKKIKDLRLKNGMSQNELAMQCNFEKATMSRIESGQTNPTVRTLHKIATALGVPVAELFQE